MRQELTSIRCTLPPERHFAWHPPSRAQSLGHHEHHCRISQNPCGRFLGGAIALGHPIGSSGARIVGALSRMLTQLESGTLRAAVLCGGGGRGSAVILEAR
ncbi:MAG: hypothetical protein ACKVI0_06410 [Actinomycetales bacterium]